jgi:hypothetical protein
MMLELSASSTGCCLALSIKAATSKALQLVDDEEEGEGSEMESSSYDRTGATR